MKRTSKSNDALVRSAVQKALDTGNLNEAADYFGLDAEELDGHRKKFLLDQLDQFYPVAPAAEVGTEPGWWPRFWDGYGRVILIRLLFTAASMVLFYWVPFLLRPLVDPATGIIVWAGFTALYQLSFASLGVEAVFFVAHRANFEFFNPFVGRGRFDYDTFLKSDELTAYQKCVLNQQKYLFYMALYCFLVYSLLNQFQGGQAG